MSDFLDAGRHFLSPNLGLFFSDREFFNRHGIYHQLILGCIDSECWLVELARFLPSSVRKVLSGPKPLFLGLRSTVSPLRDHELRLRRIERCQFHTSIRYSRRRAFRQRRRTRLCPEVIPLALFGRECDGRGVIIPARLKRRLLACAKPVLARSN